MCLKQRRTKDIIFRRFSNDFGERKKKKSIKKNDLNNKIKQNRLDIIRIMDHNWLKLQ